MLRAYVDKFSRRAIGRRLSVVEYPMTRVPRAIPRVSSLNTPYVYSCEVALGGCGSGGDDGSKFISYRCTSCGIKSTWQIYEDTTPADIITPENKWMFDCETEKCGGTWTSFRR